VKHLELIIDLNYYDFYYYYLQCLIEGKYSKEETNQEEKQSFTNKYSTRKHNHLGLNP
jgi:hypothetical protein